MKSFYNPPFFGSYQSFLEQPSSSLRNYTTLTHKIKARHSHPKIHQQTDPLSDSSFSPRTPRKRALRDTEKVTKIRFSLPDHNSSINSLLFYLWGFTPDPMPKADIKTKKFCGIYVVILSEGNFPNPSVSGELQASRLPRLPWLKIPRQFSLHKAILNSPRLSHFSITYHLLRQFTTLPYRKCQTHSPFTPLMFCIKDIHYTLV